MKCPNCGSMDVIDNRLPEDKIIQAQCQHCLYEWEQPYEPSNMVIL
ncbi:hypothetical protein LCGC14_3114680 [marine sediment metagenome]|uniref:Uncharacterized protein n=1 Tax=marine sediment metagenome TaxID=412755 RepID=A0A0F8YBH0_9ZZZZ